MAQMSEEIRNPSKIVPASMLCSIVLNGTLGFGMLVAVLFSIGSLEDAIVSPTGYPIMAIFLQATGSPGGSAAMISIIVILSFCATIAILASSSRLTWSFARDRGLPGWQYLSRASIFTSSSSILLTQAGRTSYLFTFGGDRGHRHHCRPPFVDQHWLDNSPQRRPIADGSRPFPIVLGMLRSSALAALHQRNHEARIVHPVHGQPASIQSARY